MPSNLTNKLSEKFTRFRQDLYNCFNSRQDTVIELLDALAGNIGARSTVELSLNPLFRREYSALYKAIEEAFYAPGEEFSGEEGEKSPRQQQVYQLLEALAQVVPQPKERAFQLWGLDVTPMPRPYARPLEDRSFIYQPNSIKGNKPINIGHPYSILSVLPEKAEPNSAPWSIPLSGIRVESSQTGLSVGSEQINLLLNHPSFSQQEQLNVLVVDSAYSARPFVTQQVKHENLVSIVRVRGNRVFYRCPPLCDSSQGKGHPRWYGDRFDLKDETTWHESDENQQTSLTTARGKVLAVKIRAWHQMLMRGRKDCPMHLHPFTLIQIQVTDEMGKTVWKPMWLSVFGQRRHQLTLAQSWQAYRQRYDLEHFNRFGKQKLLMNSILTPEVEREENWVQLSLLAYVQLWAARDLAVNLPRPWERYLPSSVNGHVTPSVVQRDFTRIISQIGTPAQSPKRRGKSLGRTAGESQPPRPRHQVVKKGSSKSRLSAIAA